MRELLRRWFPRRTLEGVRRPAWVRIDGRVLGGPKTESPLTHFHAQAFRIYWVEGTVLQGRDSRNGIAFSDTIASGWIGQDLIIAQGDLTIRVPLEGLSLVADIDRDDASPLTGRPPPGFEYLLQRPATGGLYYREHAIHEGDRVTLRAKVHPNERAGGYRTPGRAADGCHFSVKPKTDAVIVDASV